LTLTDALQIKKMMPEMGPGT